MPRFLTFPPRMAGRALAVLAWLLLACASAAYAAGEAPNDDADDTDATLATSRKSVDQLQEAIPAAETLDGLAKLRAQAVGLQAQANAIVERLTGPSANVDARLGQLGAAPAGKSAESPQITAERASLQAEHGRLDTQLKLAKLIALESQQSVEQIDAASRTRMTARLGERSPSLLSAGFWSDFASSWPHDRPRLVALASHVEAAARAAPAWMWIAAWIVAIAAIAAVRPAHAFFLRIASSHVPPGRLRRSLLALMRTLMPTLAVLVAVQALRWAFLGGGAASDDARSIASTVANALVFATYIAALGRALLSPTRPSWRLVEMPDTIATMVRNDALWFGIVIGIGFVLNRLAELVNSGLAAVVAISCLSSLAVGALLARSARRVERARYAMLASEHADEVPPRSLVGLALVVGSWVVLVVSGIALLLGYVALGTLLVTQVAWVIVVGNSAYLLAAVVDDACETWIAGRNLDRDGDGKEDEVPTPRRQAAVLLSGTTRVIIAVVALTLMLAPLGQDPEQLARRAERLADGVTLGEFRILPGSIAEAVAILVFGILAVRAAQQWLMLRYLPTTKLDAGMRSSTTTLLGYVGIVIAVALSLSALGIGLERVAWVASALSVGIGFGLQAVVQNFVSGLILLTERPVKVGDWVALGDVEGDIRRINVRATEIQMGDRSTVIVPNSEFITKVVRNVTMGSPMGLVQIKLPLPLDSDVERVRETILAAFAEHESVVDTPPPNVQLDAIANNGLMFVATGSVTSPRQIGNVRSALLFDILSRFRAAGIAMGGPPTLVLREGSAVSAAAPPEAPGR